MKLLRRLALLLALALAAVAPAGCGIFGGSYYRLRGSPEIHESDCPRLRRASPGGIVRASRGDGPPCYTCMHEDALEWARDPD
jgi:hypothetical protein